MCFTVFLYTQTACLCFQHHTLNHDSVVNTITCLNIHICLYTHTACLCFQHHTVNHDSVASVIKHLALLYRKQVCIRDCQFGINHIVLPLAKQCNVITLIYPLVFWLSLFSGSHIFPSNMMKATPLPPPPHTHTPWGPWGFKTRIGSPYSHAHRKRRLKWSVFSE